MLTFLYGFCRLFSQRRIYQKEEEMNYYLLLALLFAFSNIQAVFAEDDHTGTVTSSSRGPNITLDLPKTPKENSYELTPRACEGKTAHHLMKTKIAPNLIKLSEEREERVPNEVALKKGLGVAVKLDDDNYNFHINYPNNKQGGRSYGWSHKQVGDWSDREYLDQVIEYTSSASNLKNFYSTIVKMLGKCDATTLSSLSKQGQQVANNFFAIFEAEQYRRIVSPNTRWDDSLFQVTLLSAFHSGQDKFTKFYEGKFTDKAVDQSKCAYHGRPKPDESDWREARMMDYWQFGRSVKLVNGKCKGTSGINPTRKDFAAMGKAITSYYGDENETLNEIKSIVKGDKRNIIQAISEYFTGVKLKAPTADSSEASRLASLVGDFMAQLNKDANKITSWVKRNQ